MEYNNNNNNNNNDNNGNNNGYNADTNNIPENINNIHQNTVSGENFYMFNGTGSVGPNNINNTNPIDVNFMPAPPVKKKKRGGFRRVLSYVLVGVVCAAIGGAATLGSALYVLPNTGFFQNSPLYKNLAKNTASTPVYDVHPTSTTTEQGAMTVTEIAKKVGPAVVGVSTKSVASNGFFGQQVSEGMGSGMILNSDGYVLTNNHVVEGAQSVKVIFNNGKEVNAKVVNTDPTHDVAVVKITDQVTMPGVVELGTSETLQAGESVVAIGNPLGKEFLGSVTSGIVSAVNRNLGDKDINYIQTDAAINNGNSGGPLLNSQGQVIGINTAKIDTTGTNNVDGMGFAIPIDLVKGEIPNLSKPVLMIGISGRDVDAATAKANSLVEGVFVSDVSDYSPADKGGIHPGDVIVKFDGKTVKTIAELNSMKAQHKDGDTVTVQIYRDGSYKDLQLKLTTNTQTN
ncbi:MAG: trypsin-like peptidase domain-containing protein [Bacillota bacterium]|nr:trypsin-like peptidase domain-containing protein [Bacillota bacterium]